MFSISDERYSSGEIGMTASEEILDAITGLDKHGGGGWPDRTYLKDGILIAVEYKRHGDRLTRKQKERLQQIAKTGGRAFVVTLQEILGSGRTVATLEPSVEAPERFDSSRRLSADILTQIRQAILAGQSTRKIAKTFGVSVGTVRHYEKQASK